MIAISLFLFSFTGLVFSGDSYYSNPCLSDSLGAYIVQEGDTCTSLANSLNTVSSTITRYNPFVGVACTLQVGKQLCLPKPITCAKSCPTCYAQKVVTKDTCTSLIGNQNSTQFTKKNPTFNCNSLMPGNVVCQDGAILCPNTYNVTSGDTCLSISSQFNIQIPILQYMNPKLNCSALPVNNRLCVPKTPVCPRGLYERDVTRFDTCSRLIYSTWGMGNLYLNNPAIDCSNLQIGNVICLGE